MIDLFYQVMVKIQESRILLYGEDLSSLCHGRNGRLIEDNPLGPTIYSNKATVNRTHLADIEKIKNKVLIPYQLSTFHGPLPDWRKARTRL